LERPPPGAGPRIRGEVFTASRRESAATCLESQRFGVMIFSRRQHHWFLVACLGSLTTTALAAGSAAAAPASTSITGAPGKARLAFQVPADYRQQGSLTSGSPLDGRYSAQHVLESEAICTTAMTVTGQLRTSGQRPVRQGAVVRWRVGQRTDSLSRVDAAGRLADGGRWWASGTSSIDTRTNFPTSEAHPYFRFGVADVRAPGELPTGRSVLVKVIVKSGITLPPAPLPAPDAVPSAAQEQQCQAYGRQRLPADIRRVLRHLDVKVGADANPPVG
jgi:hypothetical protein